MVNKELTVAEAIAQNEPILLFHGDVAGHEETKRTIEISKDGRYIHAVKPDTTVNYSFDLKRGCYIKHKKDHPDCDVETAKITGWFYGNDVITYDYKFGLLILYNKFHRYFSGFRSVARFIEALKEPESLYYEQWIGAGVNLRPTATLMSIKNDGMHVDCEYQRLFGRGIHKPPSAVHKILLDLLKKMDVVDIDTLNEHIDHFSPEKYRLLSELQDYNNEEYEEVLLVSNGYYGGRRDYVNILEDDGWSVQRDRNRLLNLISKYNLQLDSFMPYLRKLHMYEHTNLDWVLDNYKDYLDAELFLRNGKMRKVNKYPANLVQMHHNRTAVMKDIEEERRRRQDELERKNEHLIYEDGKKYEFIPKNSDFVMIVPEGPEDVVEEGNNLGHCVGSYTSRIRKGKTFITFMRKSEDSDHSFITVEIKEGVIYTALGNHNRKLEKNERLWLQEYAKKKGLGYTAYSIIEEEEE